MDNKNNFSFWYPKIKDCGMKVPKSIIIKVPEYLEKHFYMEDHKNDYNEISKWVEKEVVPKMERYLYFMKNAVFSNKFDAQHCFTNSDKVINDIININYAALCVGAEGWEEIVLREIINYDRQNTPTIYNGLPLRSEFRVFYDFDNNKVLYSANYWDYEYCSKSMYEKTDKIIFDYMKEKLVTDFMVNQKDVENEVAKHMTNVDLTGKWSVDVLYDENNTMWLIDMALAENSSYWDANKCSK